MLLEFWCKWHLACSSGFVARRFASRCDVDVVLGGLQCSQIGCFIVVLFALCVVLCEQKYLAFYARDAESELWGSVAKYNALFV